MIKDNIRILVDGQDRGQPAGLSGVNIQYAYEPPLRGFTPSGPLSWRGGEMWTYFKNKLDTDICGFINLELELKCPPLFPDYFSIVSMRAAVADIRYDCTKCELTINPVNRDPYSVMQQDGNLSAEYCKTLPNQMRVAQYMTGAYHKDSEDNVLTLPMIQLRTLIDDIINEFFTATTGSIAVLGDIWQTFQSETYLINFANPLWPTLVNGDIARMIITTEIGSVYDVSFTANGGETDLEVGEKFEKLIQGAVFPASGEVIENYDKFIHRLSFAAPDAGNSSNFSLACNFPYTVSLTVNGSDIDIISQISPFVFGVKDIYISGAGGSDRICLSMQTIFQVLQTLYPFQINRDGEQTTFFNPLADIYNPTVLPPPFETPALVDKTGERLADKDVQKDKLLVGQLTKLSNFEESEQLWTKFGERVGIADPLLSNVPGFAGTAVFGGEFTLQNTNVGAVTFELQLEVDGTNVSNPISFSVSGSGSRIITFEDLRINEAALLDQCFTALTAVQVVVNYISGPPGSLITQPGSSSFYCEVTNPAGYMKENFNLYPDDNYADLTTFPNCKGVIDRTIDTRFYIGSGYKISQQLQGLHDYENLHFLVYGRGDNSNESQIFFRQLYFEPGGDAPLCFQDESLRFFFINAPLQPPILNWVHAQTLASDVEVKGYAFTRSMDQAGAITFSDSDRVGVITKGHTKTVFKELEDGTKISDFIIRALTKYVDLEECGTTYTRASILDMNYPLGEGSVSYKLLTEV